MASIFGVLNADVATGYRPLGIIPTVWTSTTALCSVATAMRGRLLISRSFSILDEHIAVFR